MVDRNGAKRAMPKGGRKGGAVFPRHNLADCVVWGRKLVAKTHSSPQPRDIIYSGVVGAKSGHGNVRISALKQYGLLEGDSGSYSATDLAKKIASAPDDEVTPLLQKAFLGPGIFEGLFKTFQGDEVSRSKLKQRAADLRVHPDETERCANVYVEGLVLAGLGSNEGDRIVHVSEADLSVGWAAGNSSESEEVHAKTALSREESADDSGVVEDPIRFENTRNRSGLNVSIAIDSSMDAEKLEKQLALLKKYGAL